MSRAQPEVLNYLRAAVDADDSGVTELAARALLATSRLMVMLLQADPNARAAARGYAERGLAMAEILGVPALRARALRAAERARIRRR